MKYTKVKISALILLFGIGGLKAQEVIPAAGGESSGSSGSASYTIGQIVYTTKAGTNGSVAEGIQQAFEISEITGLEEDNKLSLKASVFPNPSSDFLILKLEKIENLNLSFQLYDVNGRLLENGKLASSQTFISMKNYQPSTYFLKVVQKNREIKTFKIIKK